MVLAPDIHSRVKVIRDRYGYDLEIPIHSAGPEVMGLWETMHNTILEHRALFAEDFELLTGCEFKPCMLTSRLITFRMRPMRGSIYAQVTRPIELTPECLGSAPVQNWILCCLLKINDPSQKTDPLPETTAPENLQLDFVLKQVLLDPENPDTLGRPGISTEEAIILRITKPEQSVPSSIR